MSETTTIQPLEPRSQTVAAIRAKLMEGIAPVDLFATAVGRTPRTVFNWIAQGMPVEYIGQTAYVVIEPARDWLRSRKKRRSAPRGRGRPKKTF